MTTPSCVICEREEGHKATNRFGERDLNPDAPLGAMETCSFCGTLSVCPECVHERECCENLDEIQESPDVQPHKPPTPCEHRAEWIGRRIVEASR